MTEPTALAEKSVNDVLRLAPAAGPIFNRLGVDTCCGGSLPLRAAALGAGVPLEALLEELAGVLPASAADAR